MFLIRTQGTSALFVAHVHMSIKLGAWFQRRIPASSTDHHRSKVHWSNYFSLFFEASISLSLYTSLSLSLFLSLSLSISLFLVNPLSRDLSLYIYIYISLSLSFSFSLSLCLSLCSCQSFLAFGGVFLLKFLHVNLSVFACLAYVVVPDRASVCLLRFVSLTFFFCMLPRLSVFYACWFFF